MSGYNYKLDFEKHIESLDYKSPNFLEYNSKSIENMQAAQDFLGKFFIADLFSRGVSGKSLIDNILSLFKK